MNDEQLCDFYLRAIEANHTLEKIANSLESVNDDGLPTGIVTPLLDVEEKLDENNRKLESISFELYRIAETLEKIATTYSDAEKKWGNLTSLTIKTDPSDGPFESQEPEEPEGFADMA